MTLTWGQDDWRDKAIYDKILVAVDHSEISDRAVLAARDLALLSKGEVWVLHLQEREIATKTGLVMTDEPKARPTPRFPPSSRSSPRRA